MVICNNAFVELCDRFDDLLGAVFNEVPRGDPERVILVADYVMLLLSNSLYSLSWVNAN
jgi:hypothetical protein